MINTLIWTLIGIPVSFIIYILMNDVYKFLYAKNISNFSKYSIMIIIIFCSFLKGYTNKDLITNIFNYCHVK
jgi:hypothetical protein